MKPHEARDLRKRAEAEQGAQAAIDLQPISHRYPHFGWGLQTFEDGTRTLIIQIPGVPFETHFRFPFDDEGAKKLGEALSAPHVVVANGVVPREPDSGE